MTSVIHLARLTWIAWVLIVLALGLPMWLRYILPQPYYYANQPLPIAETKVQAGGIVSLTVTRCNMMPFSVTATTEWQLERQDGLRILLPNGGRPVPSGCNTNVLRGKLVPDGTPPGEYRIVGIVTAIYPWSTYAFSFESTWFEVTA